MSKLDAFHAALVTAVGRDLSTIDLWNLYLIGEGYTVGSLTAKEWAYADANSIDIKDLMDFVIAGGAAEPVNMLSNGTFDTNLTGWTVTARWIWGAGGVATAPSDAGTWANMHQALSFTGGNSYRVKWDVTARTSGDCYGRLEGGGNTPTPVANAVGSYDHVLVAPSGTLRFHMWSSSGAVLSIDNVELFDLGVL